MSIEPLSMVTNQPKVQQRIDIVSMEMVSKELIFQSAPIASGELTYYKGAWIETYVRAGYVPGRNVAHPKVKADFELICL